MARTSSDGGCGGGGGRCGGENHRNHLKTSAVAASVGKGKSCTGCLYYSSLSKLHGRNPRCLGITRTIPQVPLHRVGEAEMEANEEGRSLSSGFKYACVGYSVFLDNKDNPNDRVEKRPELPSCVGIEVIETFQHPNKESRVWGQIPRDDLVFLQCLLTRSPGIILVAKPSTSHHVPAYTHNKEDGTAVQSQPRPQKPVGPASSGDEFFGRFTRNAGLVASGVAKNLKKVGNYVKDTLDDMMYPYGRRPK